MSLTITTSVRVASQFGSAVTTALRNDIDLGSPGARSASSYSSDIAPGAPDIAQPFYAPEASPEDVESSGREDSGLRRRGGRMQGARGGFRGYPSGHQRDSGDDEAAPPPRFTTEQIHGALEGKPPKSDIMPGAVTAVGGGTPAAFIFHHTGGRGTVGGVQNTLRERGLGVQYVMDRDGNIVRTGSPGAANIKRGWGAGAGLSNRNIVGMEVIARNDKDVTPAQVAAARAFIGKNYSGTPVYGHGEVNPGHKEADEGMTIVNAIRRERGAAPVSAHSQPQHGATSSGGDPRGLIPHIRATAEKYGIDPDVAVNVARSEGLESFHSGIAGEKSYGAFQLHTGGGLGDEFRRDTGLDPSDPENERATIDYALRNAAKGGWGPFHGAHNRYGYGPWHGIGRAARQQDNAASAVADKQDGEDAK